MIRVIMGLMFVAMCFVMIVTTVQVGKEGRSLTSGICAIAGPAFVLASLRLFEMLLMTWKI